MSRGAYLLDANESEDLNSGSHEADYSKDPFRSRESGCSHNYTHLQRADDAADKV